MPPKKFWKWKQIFGISAFVLLNASWAFTETKSDSKESKPTASDPSGAFNIIALANNLKAHLPEGKIKCIADTYMKVVKPDAYSAAEEVKRDNEGIKQYFQNILNTSPCFARVAAQFYKDLAIPGEVNLEDYFGISLADEAGRGKNERTPVGSLWQKAMQATGQDPEAAMSLIGLCSGSLAAKDYSLSPEEAETQAHQELKDSLERVDVIKESLRLHAKSNGPEAEKYLLMTAQTKHETRILELKLAIKNKQISNKALIPCFGSYNVLVPKALGSDADIDNDLKEKIRKSYGMDPSQIMAKVYHFNNAAYLGCQLAKCKVPSAEISLLEGQAGIAYRSIVRCADIQTFLARKEMIEKAFRLSYDKVDQKTFLSAKSIASICAVDSSKLFCTEITAIANEAGGEGAAVKVNALFQDIDATVLYRKWYLGGKSFLGMNLPCLGPRLDGPKDLMKAEAENRNGNFCGISAWSKERCEAARKKLAEWDVDYTWTRKQHEIGARFGAEKCADVSSKRSLEERMCALTAKNKNSSLKKNPTVNPTGVQ